MNPLRAARRWAKKRYDEARGRTTSLSVASGPEHVRTLNRAETRALHKRAGVKLGAQRRRHSPTKWKSHQTMQQRWAQQAYRDELMRLEFEELLEKVREGRARMAELERA